MKNIKFLVKVNRGARAPECVQGNDGRKSTCNLLLLRLCTDDQGQDIAEYAVMLAVILVLVVGTIRLVGSKANKAFSSVASSLQ
jgi:Flp pilus assembly pilin Flp